MNNKVLVPNEKYQLLKAVALLILLPAVMAIILLFTFRATDTRNYNGNVIEISGIVFRVDVDEDGAEILLSNNETYNANRIKSCYPDFDLKSLRNKQITIYVPEKQIGVRPQPWVIGIKQGDVTLVDYHKVIADGKAEAKLGMIISGSIAGALFAISVGFYLWKMRVSPIKEEDLYKDYCEFEKLRQPSCPQYKLLSIAVVVYLVLTLVCCIVIGAVCESNENIGVQISVSVVMCLIFAWSTVAILLLPWWLAKKERQFYVENFPFDFTDISHIIVHGKQKKYKQELQAELIETRKNFPHRHFDAGNGFVVDFTENGVEFFDEEAGFATPCADFVFGEGSEEAKLAPPVYKLTYQQLNLEALPYYRPKDHPLTVVVKSRIEDNFGLPEEMQNDLHFMLDSNLLATLLHFDVAVENLQYILDNKAQLIKENCTGRKKKKGK